MLLMHLKSKKRLLLALFLLTFASCKQSEFYDKAALLETGPNVTSENPDATAGGGTTSGGTNSGDSTTPASSTGGDLPDSTVLLPPTGTDPGSSLPGGVVLPPVISPPVVTNPPSGGTTTDPALPGVILNERVEIFTQDNVKTAPVDILWVIDDSGSMADNQEALARNFNNFINQFLDKNIDFKMAITTTDGTSIRNGKMVGDSSMLTRAAAIGNRTAFTNNFTKWVKVGTSGSGIEQGLKTASAFLDRYSASYLREDAYLAIVFLSDEEDQSDKKVSEYLLRYQSVKKNAGMVKAYSIVTQTLQPTAQWETIGLRYNELAKGTGGMISDINDDFSVTLKDIGGNIVNLLDSFALADSPYDNNITVLVNSVQVNSGWTFDISSRSLKFNADSIPSPGAKIEVHYKVKATVLGAI